MKAIIKRNQNDGLPERIEIIYSEDLPSLEINYKTACEILWNLFWAGEEGLHDYLKENNLI